MNSVPKFYDTKAVAEMLCASPITVRRWVEEGKLKATRPTGPKGKILVSEKQLEMFLRERTRV